MENSGAETFRALIDTDVRRARATVCLEDRNTIISFDDFSSSGGGSHLVGLCTRCELSVLAVHLDTL